MSRHAYCFPGARVRPHLSWVVSPFAAAALDVRKSNVWVELVDS